MSITVLKPGVLSTFQDIGRHGFQHLGVPAAGAMDERAHRLASLAAGNDADCASLEATLVGPQLRFDTDACFALAGADLGATLNGQPLPACRPLLARAGDVLAWGRRRHGARAYLAVYGGYDLAPLMGSQSTYLRAGFGGLAGRALAKGDTIGLRRTLPAGARLDTLQAALSALRVYLPAALGEPRQACVRILPGLQWQAFSRASRHALLEHAWRIGAQSDRMGYRLEGPALGLSRPRQQLSGATAPGTIQVPDGGAPIVLMADRQTTGGYPKIAQVASVGLPALAQLAPGDDVCFELISLRDAQTLDLRREHAFARLHASLAPLRALLGEHYRTTP